MLVLLPIGFASVCRQSTDFHFPGIDSQLQEIKEHGRLANQGRKEKAATLSPSMHTSESLLSNSESPSHSSDNGTYTSMTCAYHTKVLSSVYSYSVMQSIIHPCSILLARVHA